MDIKKLTTISLSALMLAGAVGINPASAQEQTRRGQRGQISQEQREQRKAEREEFRQNLSEEQIETLESAHELRKEGNHEDAKALLDEAGIVPPVQERREENKEQREAVKTAIDEGDYEAFVEATENSPVDIEITEEQFEGLQEVKELRDAGDYESAKALAEELDLPKLGKKKMKKFASEVNENLSEEQKTELQEIRSTIKNAETDEEKEEAKAAAQAIFDEAGIEKPKPGFMDRIRGWFKR